MNVKRLIEKYKEFYENVFDFGAKLACQLILQDLEQLDELETGHADEAPRYLKNILARLRELSDHDREVWLKAIMGEFKEDFSHAKWREGYEIEEEKKFFVKIKCLSEEYKYLNYFKSCREWLFSEKEETKEYRTAHTRKQLEEAGFGWVFDCPGIEIEEVE